MKPISNAALIAVVENLIVQEPHEFDGHKWAAKPNEFYCKAAGLTARTFGRMIKDAPFVRRHKRIDGKPTCLLRVGVAGPKSVHETALVLRGIWRNKTGMATPEAGEAVEKWEHQKRCLWGFAKDVMALPGLKYLDDPSDFAVAAFKGALDNWQDTVTACRIEAECLPIYSWRYRNYPNIPIMCHFNRAVAHAHICRLMEKGEIPTREENPYAFFVAGFLCDWTDPFRGHPGSALTLEELVALKAWPAKEPWKPKKYPGSAEKPLTLKEKLAKMMAEAEEEPPF